MPISFVFIIIFCIGYLIWPRPGDSQTPMSKSIDYWIFVQREPDENFSMEKYTETDESKSIVKF